MMSYIFYIIFMIPLFYFGFWYSYQFIYMVFVFFFMFLNVGSSLGLISYFFAIDYISYSLVILSLFIVSLMNLASLCSLKFNFDFFSLVNYFICFSLIMVFTSVNMFYVYMSFEFILIPIIVLVLGWGYQLERLHSGIYLFFYTLFGSLPLFVFMIFVYNDFFSLSFVFELSFNFNFFVHLLVIIPFLVSLPMFMLHFWLPSAHVQAPISGSMILAGLMLKIGGYGLIRFIFLNEYFFYEYCYVWFSLGMLGSIMVGLICLVQVDIKSLIAYSSISHMGLCLMGILTLSYLGLLGSVIMMVSHGLCSSGLFCLANICYSRIYSRSLYLISGMVLYMPMLSFFWFLFSVFNMGCPPSINFMGELLIIIGSICYFKFSFFYLAVSSFLCSCFGVYMYSFSQHGSFSFLYSYCNVFVSEFLLLICHLYPLVFLIYWFMIF
uniref:NADH dehydrogenase subunit 4 n=1 Tax=Choucentrus sinensis TaxID=3038122 RepID=UPI00315CBF2D